MIKTDVHSLDFDGLRDLKNATYRVLRSFPQKNGHTANLLDRLTIRISASMLNRMPLLAEQLEKAKEKLEKTINH